MEALVSGFEKLLWFIYRVFFTLVPPLAFIFLCFCLLKYNNPDLANKVFLSFLGIGSFNGWVLLVFAFMLNVIAESIGSEFISFREQIKNELIQKPVYSTLLAKINSDLKAKTGAGEAELVIIDFGLAKLLMIQKFAQISNFFWFFYVNYKISVATTVFMNLLTLLFLPFTIYTKFNLWSSNGGFFFCLLQGLQFALTFITIHIINKLIKNRKSFKLKAKIILGVVAIGLIAALLFTVLPFLLLRISLLAIALNSLIFFLCLMTTLLSYNQNLVTYRTLADVLLTFKYGEIVFGKDMFSTSEPPKPTIKP